MGIFFLSISQNMAALDQLVFHLLHECLKLIEFSLLLYLLLFWLLIHKLYFLAFISEPS